jgi:hypothetical protein
MAGPPFTVSKDLSAFLNFGVFYPYILESLSKPGVNGLPDSKVLIIARPASGFAPLVST